MLITDIFSDELLQQMLKEKYVRRQVHPEDSDLAILNYGEKAQYDRVWNDCTLACRGLIYRVSTGEVVARPFPKFFNWDDSGQPYPSTGTVIRAPKMDGSLGILYVGPDGDYAIATRGSFASDQAVWASSFFQEAYSANYYSGEALFNVKSGKTYLFEIIYPENRIVVDYQGLETLYLLDVIDNETGKSDLAEFDAFEWPDKVEKKLLQNFDIVALNEDIPEGEEGWVLYWPGKDFRVKVKSADYVHLHRLIFGLNARTVWETLSQGKSLSTLMDGLPDEFHQWVLNVGQELMKRHSHVWWTLQGEWSYLLISGVTDGPRKEFAQAVAKSPHKGYLFLLFDGKVDQVREAIWKEIRPRHDEFQLVSQTEDTA